MTKYWKHYNDVKPEEWPWKNFSPKEIASKGNGSLYIDVDAMDKLQLARDIYGKPMVINSAYRDPEHNKKVGGSSKSQHLNGNAFDISLEGHDPVKLHDVLRGVGFTGFGFYDTFIHVDTDRERYWDHSEDRGKFAPIYFRYL